MAFGKEMKKRMNNMRHINLKQMAEETGIDYYRLSRIQNDRCFDVKGKELEAICKSLHTTIPEMLEVEEDE